MLPVSWAFSRDFAAHFRYYGLTNHTSLKLIADDALAGTIYAPNATLSVTNTLGRPVEICGACVVNALRLEADVNFHYDENLQRLWVAE